MSLVYSYAIFEVLNRERTVTCIVARRWHNGRRCCRIGCRCAHVECELFDMAMSAEFFLRLCLFRIDTQENPNEDANPSAHDWAANAD